MSKLRVVAESLAGYLCIPENGEPLVGDSLVLNEKTPNSSMAKDGIYRYPFNSLRVELNSVPKLRAKGRVNPYDPDSLRNPDSKTVVEQTTLGANNEAYIISNGGCAVVTHRPYSVAVAWLRDFGDYSAFCYGWPASWYNRAAHISCTFIRHSDWAYYTIWPFTNEMTPEEALNKIRGGVLPPADLSLCSGSYGYDLEVVPMGSPIISRDVVDNLCTYASSACSIDEHFLATQVINDLRLTDVNIPAFFTELPKFGQSTLDICKGIKELTASTGFAEAARAAGKANLAYQYGDRLSISDAEALLKAGREASATCELFGPRWTHNAASAESSTTGLKAKRIVRYSVKASPSDTLSKGIYGLANVFNLQNVWDLIPFSFVVDWFVNVADSAAALDAVTISNTLNYDQIYRSETTVVDVDNYDAGDYLLTGHVVRHSRDKKYSMPEPDAKLNASIPNAAQWVNGGSLLTQTKLKF